MLNRSVVDADSIASAYVASTFDFDIICSDSSSNTGGPM